MNIQDAEKYLSAKAGKHLAGFVTAAEVLKAGIVCLLTEEGEYHCWDCGGEHWNKWRYEKIQKAFDNRWNIRRYINGETVPVDSEEGTYISWITIGEIFFDWYKDQLEKEI